MAEVGTYYITVMPEMSKFTGAVKTALGKSGADGGKQYSNGFIDTIRGSAIGTALGNMALKAGNALKSGIQVGIGRLDTLENFPRVMESLGYKAEDASKSIQLIRERLRGLPTATQDVVRLTQAIADSTGDLGLATDAALGFNDMMLASGASTEEATQAQGVLNRVLGKGNATVAQWQSLQSVMPAQLAAVARELLGEGASVEELRDKLNGGEVSWNDFLRAIAKVDQEGTGHVKSFREQAEANSIGIETAIKNVGNRIGEGWASIMGAIGQANISGAISGTADKVENAMHRIADGVKYVVDAIGSTSIAENLGKVKDAFADAFATLGSGGTDLLKSITDTIIDLANNGLAWLADHGDDIRQFATDMRDMFDRGLSWVTEHGDGIKTALVVIAGAVVTLVSINGILEFANGMREIGSSLAIFKDLTGMVAGIGDLGAAFQLTSESGGLLAPVLSKIGDVITLLSTKLEPLKAIFGLVATTIGELGTKFQLATMTGGAFSGVTELLFSTLSMLASPAVIIGGAIAAIVLEIKHLWDTSEEFRNTVKEAWDDICAKFTEVTSDISSSLSSIAEDLKPLVDAFMEKAGWVLGKLGEIVDFVSKILDPVLSFVIKTLVNLFSSFADTVSGVIGMIAGIIHGFATGDWSMFTDNLLKAWKGLWGLAKAPFKAIFDLVMERVFGIKDGWDKMCRDLRNGFDAAMAFIRGLLSGELEFPHIKIPHIKWHMESVLDGAFQFPVFDGVEWYAKGGVFDTATIIGVGEAGREAALPLNARTYGEIAAGIAGRLGSTQPVVVSGNNFYVREEADIDRIADALSRKISRERNARRI